MVSDAKVIECLTTLAGPDGLQADQLRRLAACFSFSTYPAGAQIFAAGEPASALYLVCSGLVAIRHHPYDGGVLDVAVIQPGGGFGWSAALRRAVYTSSAIALTEVQAVAITAATVHRLMSTDPELSHWLLERAAHAADSRFGSLGRQVIRQLVTSPLA